MRGYRFYYSTLTGLQKTLYKELYSGVIEHSRYVTLSCSHPFVSAGGVEPVIYALHMDNPYIFWFNRLVLQFEYSSDTGTKAIIRYTNNKKTEMKLRKEIQAEASRVIKASGASRKGLSDLERVTAIHDYMCRNYKYDFASRGNHETGVYSDCYTIKGAFMNQLAVCEGLAKAMSLMLTSLGIPNVLVDGSTNKDAIKPDHLWVAVRLDGKLKHIDIASDIANSIPDKVARHFFLVPSEKIRETHYKFKVPEAV